MNNLLLFIFIIFFLKIEIIHSKEFFGIKVPGYIDNYDNYTLVENSKSTYHEINFFDVIPSNPSDEFSEYQVRTFRITNDELIKNYKPKKRNDFILSLRAQGKKRYSSFEECERNNIILFQNLSTKYNNEGFTVKFEKSFIDENKLNTLPMYLIKNNEVTHRIYGWCGSNHNINDFKKYKFPKLNIFLEKVKNLYKTKYHQVFLVSATDNNDLENALLELIERFKRGDYSYPKNLKGF
jgi:hypothetical protein